MADQNYGFSGSVPPGASVQSNITRALEFQSTHSAAETFEWFYEQVRNNKDGHLPPSESMDYKQIDPSYADFGNYNFGAVGKALGYPDAVLQYGAGWAQGRADGLTRFEAAIRSISDFKNKGDNPGDQDLINDGIQAVKDAGIAGQDQGTLDALNEYIKKDLSRLYESANQATRGFHQGVVDFLNAAQRWFQPVRRDPLTLDLNGNGLETVAPSTPPLLFDHSGNGLKQSSGWVAPNDGFLVLDRNGNGTIDSGAELFGDSTPLADGTNAIDGFDALAQEDTNGDGVVNSQDANWANLQVWQDLNQDGISQSGELSSLDQLGITGINVGATQHSQVLPNGNQIADKGTFTYADGSTGSTGLTGGMADINLAVDTFHRTFADRIPANDDVLRLVA